jgi:hypothetical protein
LRRRLNAVAEGMIDLKEPFRRRDIYHWWMNGSYSLKSVLPVLVESRVCQFVAAQYQEHFGRCEVPRSGSTAFHPEGRI